MKGRMDWMVGNQFVVNDLPDTTIYTVAKIDGFGVMGSYILENGQVAWCNMIDMCYIKKPSKSQLKGATK